METADVYRKKAKARLDEIGAKIEQLKAKAEQGADARIPAKKKSTSSNSASRKCKIN